MVSKRSLTDKVIVITGASSGIGRALARQCGYLGAKTVVVARRKELLDTLAAEIRANGGTAFPLKTDVSSEKAILRMVAAVLDEFGRIDVLVNNAASGIFGRIENTPSEEMRALFDVNFFGPYSTCRAVIPLMKRQGYGHIINVGSMSTFGAFPFTGGYASTKHAIKALSDALRRELRPYNIDVSMVFPGTVDTGFNSALKNLEGTPLGRRSKPSNWRARIRRKAGKILFPSVEQSPESAGRQIVRCIQRPSAYVFPDRLIKFVVGFYFLFPSFWDRIYALKKKG